jgi:hypothetical protein
MMRGPELAAELEGVNLRASLVAGQEVMNGVQDPQVLIIGSWFTGKQPTTKVPWPAPEFDAAW